MGCKPAPDVANIVMASLDRLILLRSRNLFTTHEAVKYYRHTSLEGSLRKIKSLKHSANAGVSQNPIQKF